MTASIHVEREAKQKTAKMGDDEASVSRKVCGYFTLSRICGRMLFQRDAVSRMRSMHPDFAMSCDSIGDGDPG